MKDSPDFIGITRLDHRFRRKTKVLGFVARRKVAAFGIGANKFVADNRTQVVNIFLGKAIEHRLGKYTPPGASAN